LLDQGDLLSRCQVTALLPGGTHKATWWGVPLLAAGGRRVMGAVWRLGPRQVGPLLFEPGDLCLELFDETLDFNVFAVYGPAAKGEAGPGTGKGCLPAGGEPRFRFKGWYVNLATAVEIRRQGHGETITYTDWYLDFIVEPGGRVAVVDEDAYRRLPQMLAPDQWERAAAARARLEQSLRGDAPSFLQRLYDETVRGPGEAFLLEMTVRYGLPAAAHSSEPLAVAESGHWFAAAVSGLRVAEALFVVDAGPGQTLLHGKTFYPAGALRLPGGGIARGEAPDAAAVREALEETGLDTTVEAFVAYLSVPLAWEGRVVTMPTYVFRLRRRDPAAAPQPQGEEDIDVFQPVPVAQLSTVAWRLAGLEGSWAQWGRYRALQHWLAYRGAVQTGWLPAGAG